MLLVVKNYRSDDLRISYDWSRAVFTPDFDYKYVCAGSQDGMIIFWDREKGDVVKTLKGEKWDNIIFIHLFEKKNSFWKITNIEI